MRGSKRGAGARASGKAPGDLTELLRSFQTELPTGRQQTDRFAKASRPGRFPLGRVDPAAIRPPRGGPQLFEVLPCTCVGLQGLLDVRREDRQAGSRGVTGSARRRPLEFAWGQEPPGLVAPSAAR